jgi:hypothetical protein
MSPAGGFFPPVCPNCHFQISNQERKMAPSQRGSRSSDNPGFNPGSVASTGVQDILRDIMPVLARLQMRAPQMPSPGPASPLSAEAAAAVALVSDMGADSLRRLTAYLDAHAGKFEGLENCVPLVTTAAHALAAGDYARSFTLIFDVYRAIAVFRADDPNLPLPASIKPADMARGDSGETHPDASPPRPAH